MNGHHVDRQYPMYKKLVESIDSETYPNNVKCTVLRNMKIPPTIAEACIYSALKDRPNGVEIRKRLCIARSEIVTDPDAIDILQTLQDEKDLGEFILERMQEKNIAEADRDVAIKATEIISLPYLPKDAKEQNIAPVFCLVCKRNGKRKELSCLAYISELFKLNIYEEQHRDLYLQSYSESHRTRGETYFKKLVSHQPPPEQTPITEKQYKCNQCKKSFTDKRGLKRHVEGVHDKIKYNNN